MSLRYLLVSSGKRVHQSTNQSQLLEKQITFLLPKILRLFNKLISASWFPLKSHISLIIGNNTIFIAHISLNEYYLDFR